MDAQQITTTIITLTILIALYMLPATIAKARKNHNFLAISLTNLFFGWTCIGWFAALIWACTNPAPKT